MTTSKFKLLVGMTGSIAAYKTCGLISQLVKLGHEVQVVGTPSLFQFVGAATLEGLTGRPVQTETFAPGQMMDHIHLARWADLFIVAPLSAHHAALFAQGLAPDLLSTLLLAFEKEKPVYLAPAMNAVMWANSQVQQNMKHLQERGYQILEPKDGPLACGETGTGRMVEPEDILNTVFGPKRNGRILITLGGTQEPIDGARTIANLSTGETGQNLSVQLAQMGFDVDAIVSRSVVQKNPWQTQRVLPSSLHILSTFRTHHDLDEQVREALRKKTYNLVIHLAAVSDFSVAEIQTGEKTLAPTADRKFKSDESLTLKLKRNKKIVNEIKEYALSPKPRLIAFKLTQSPTEQDRLTQAHQLLKSSGAEAVVLNDLTEINKSKNDHPCVVIRNQQPELRLRHISDLAEVIKNDFMS